VAANNKTKPWEQAIRGAARAARVELLPGAIEIELEFHMPRPGSNAGNSGGHYGTGRNAGIVKPQFVDAFHTSKPDLDKLERAVGDALTKLCYGDDSVIVRITGSKFYSETPGVFISYKKAKPWTPKSMKLESPSQGELLLEVGTKPATEST
jgi:Holliday junction resolvase RusA-like endonuclease